MLRPLPAPIRPETPEAIKPTFDRLTAAARFQAPLGHLTPADHAGLIKRTAQLCGVTVAQVKEVCGG